MQGLREDRDHVRATTVPVHAATLLRFVMRFTLANGMEINRGGTPADGASLAVAPSAARATQALMLVCTG